MRPAAFSADGDLIVLDSGRCSAAFRLDAVNMDKTRACDDLTYGLVNLSCVADTRIIFPNWGHIGQLCIMAYEADRNIPFSKAVARKIQEPAA